MFLVLSCFVVGSAVIALSVAWQIKHIEPSWLAVAKYQLYIAPALFLANIILSVGFGQGHNFVKNTPAVIATQTVIYYFFLTLFSVYIVGDKISLVKAVSGVALIIAGVIVLKS